jgi:hypothetical protein
MKRHRFRVKTARLEQIGRKSTWFPVNFTIKAIDYDDANRVARRELRRRYETWNEEWNEDRLTIRLV